MASKREMSEVAASGSSTGNGGQPTPAAKRGRGRPRGSKNKKTLEREAAAMAAAAAASVNQTSPRCLPSTAAGGAPSSSGAAAPAVPSSPVSEEVSPPPGFPARPVCGTPALSLGGTQVHEFFVNIALDGRSRLPIPGDFARVFSRYAGEVAFVREASPGQGAWAVLIQRDDNGGMFFTGAWRQFVLRHGIRPFSGLLFRHREETAEFTVRVFVGGCWVPHPAVPAV